MSLVFLFPGQGSQKIAMLSDYAEHHGLVKDTFAEASEALGFDVWKVCQDEEKLNQTAYTQPALLTASIAIWRLWQKQNGVKPVLVAGHSLGEYSALVAAETLSLADAVVLVHKRGMFMQEAVASGVGAMAAVLGKAAEDVARFCEQVSDSETIIAPANYNCNGQVVVSGHAKALDKLASLAQDEKFKLIKLPVSVPSHCELMQPAAEELQNEFKSIKLNNAQIPVIQNVDAFTRTCASDIQDALIKQLTKPVMWQQTLMALNDNNIAHAIECGPGKVLAGLAKRQKVNFKVHTTNTLSDFEQVIHSTV